MQIGMIGLGRIGANMVRRLLKAGHQCVVFDTSAKAVTELTQLKAKGSSSLAEFAQKLSKPRTVWLMVSADAVDETITAVLPRLERGDILIDGGNSYYVDDIRRTKELSLSGNSNRSRAEHPLLKTCMFVLRLDGYWMDFNTYASQGKPEAMDEIVFPSTIKVIETFGRPFGRARVLDLPIDEAGLSAWIERYSSNPLQAVRAWVAQYQKRHRKDSGG